MHIELPDGQWADLIEPAELRNGDRKAVNRAISVEVDDETRKRIWNAGINDDIVAAMLCRAVIKWSLPLLLPSQDPDVLDDLTLDQADALALAVEPHLKLIHKRDDPAKKDTGPTAGSAS